ncbi:MAG: PIN domain-containing protein [Actinobacteria bacterium]|nr:PIN domain-containing protein [Actinomycetota bacterium]
MSTGVFLDTSALFAAFDTHDSMHPAVAAAWEVLLSSGCPLHTTNYVAVELITLLQRRFGPHAVDALTSYVLPWVNFTWVVESLHVQAMASLMAARRRDLSLVDCASFVVMRRLGLRRAFTLDRHFEEQGFEVLPAP